MGIVPEHAAIALCCRQTALHAFGRNLRQTSAEDVGAAAIGRAASIVGIADDDVATAEVGGVHARRPGIAPP